MRPLTTVEKNKAKVAYATLIAALVMSNVNKQVGLEGEQPAVQQCTILIDELLAGLEEDRRNLVIGRIQRARLKFVKKAEHTDAASALIAVIQVFAGPTFKSKKGTRFDFIRDTLRKNVVQVRDTMPFSESAVENFETDFKKSILSV